MQNKKTEISRQALLSILEDQELTLTELKKSQEHYKTLFNLSPTGIIILDSSGYIYDVNDEFVKMMGYKKNELIGKHISFISYSDNKKKINTNVKKILSGEILEQKVTNLKKDGTKIIFELREKAMSLPNGEMGLLTICRDITKQKAAEEALKKSEERYKGFISQINEGVYRCEIIPPMPIKLSVEKQIDYLYDNVILAECNKTLLKMYGLKKENDFVGKSLVHFHGGRNNRTNRKALRIFIKSGYLTEHAITEEISLKGNIKYFDNNSTGVIVNNHLVRVWGTQTDITLQKKSELALKESEEKFRNLSEYSNTSIFIIQGETFVYANKNALKTVGYTFKEVKKLKFQEIVHPNFRETLKKNARKRLKGEKIPNRYEFIIISKKGKEIWVDFSASNIMFEGIPSILCTSIDITDKKFAELNLKESEEKFRTLTENANSGILILQGEKFVYINNAFTKISGYNFDDLSKSKSWNIVHPEFRNLVRRRALSRQTGKNIINNYEFKMISKSGKEIWIDFSVTMINYKGKPAILGTGHDITEKKNIEISLRESEEKFRSLAESTNSGIFIIKGERFIYMNPAIEKLLACKWEIAKNMKFIEFCHPEYKQLVIERSFARQTGKRVTSRYDFKIVDLKGNVKWIDFFASKINFMGEPSILGTVFDITEKKEYEISLKNSEEKFRKFTEATNSGIFIVKGEYFDYFNPASEKLTGYTQEDARKLKFWEVVHPDHRKLIKKRGLARQKGQKVPQRYEFKIITKKGNTRWVDFFASKIIYQGVPSILGTIFDITDKKNTENKLLESELRYRTLFEQANVGIGLSTFDGKVVSVNKTMSDIFGFTEEQWKRMNVTLMYYSKNDRTEIINKVKKFGSADNQIVRLKTSKGDYKWINLSIRTISLENKKYLLSYFSDISALIETEKKLENSLERLEKSQEIASMGFLDWNLKTNKIYWSNEICRVFGNKKDTNKQTYESSFKIIHPSDRDFVKKNLALAVREKKEFDIDYRMITNDKRTVWVHAQAELIKDNKGKPLYLLGTVLDITKRKFAEDKLLEQLKKNEKILSTSLDGFILADTSGKIIDVNDSYCKMMKYKKEELIGKNIENRETNLSKNEIEEKVKRFVKKGYDRFETVHIDKNSEKVDLDVSISLMDFGGKNYVAAFVRDIRERKNYENEILEKQKQLRALSANLQSVREEERKMLARELHDELGQILTAAKIDLSLLEKSSPENKREIKEISNLINEGLVTTKKIVSQLRPALLQELGLVEAVKELLNKFKQNTKLKTYLRTNVKDIKIDIEQSLSLYRIIQESLTNIAKHSKSDSARVNIYSKNKELIITIKDNGVGFDPEQTNFGGFGLLGMKERLIPLNGDIKIKSKIGIGTTVTVKAPMDK